MTMQKTSETRYIGVPNKMNTILISRIIKFKNNVKYEIKPFLPPKMSIKLNKISASRTTAFILSHPSISST